MRSNSIAKVTVLAVAMTGLGACSDVMPMNMGIFSPKPAAAPAPAPAPAAAPVAARAPAPVVVAAPTTTTTTTEVAAPKKPKMTPEEINAIFGNGDEGGGGGGWSG
jgi:cell division septation protein DedD